MEKDIGNHRNNDNGEKASVGKKPSRRNQCTCLFGLLSLRSGIRVFSFSTIVCLCNAYKINAQDSVNLSLNSLPMMRIGFLFVLHKKKRAFKFRRA